MAAQVLGNGRADGTHVVASSSEKLHLYGGTTVDQPAAITTTGSTAPSMKTRINQIIAALREIGAIAT